MSLYKIQLSVDGYGTSYDGSIWKLASNSVVIWVASDHNSKQPLWHPWYWPLLRPFNNYIPAFASDAEKVIRWCIDHDDLAQQIAHNAYCTAKYAITAEVMMEYVQLLLQHTQTQAQLSNCS